MYINTSDVTYVNDAERGYDNNFILAGRKSFNAYILKITPGGDIVAEKHFNAFNGHFSKLIPTSDSGALVIAYTHFDFPPASGNISILKFDKTLTLQWSKKYFTMYEAQSFYATQMDIIADDNDQFIFCINNDRQSTTLGKIDNLGNLIWQKKISTSLYSLTSSSLTKKNTSIYLTYNTVNNDSYAAYLTKFNSVDGTMQWAKYYKLNNGKNLLFKDIKTGKNNELIVNGLRSETYVNYGSQTITHLDTNGNLLRSVSIIRSFNQEMIDASDLTVLSDDGMVAGMAKYDGSFHHTLYLTGLDENLALTWAKKYSSPFLQTIRRIINDPDNRLFVFGELISGWPFTFQVMKTDGAGNIPGCENYNDTVQLSQNNIVSLSQSETISASFISPTVINLPIITYPGFVKTEVCIASNSCDSIKLTGTNMLCSLADTLIYTARRNTGCNNLINFTIDSTFGKIVSRTDSSVEIQFLKPGSAKLYGVLQTPCATLKDSILINIFIPATNLNLGPDIKYCDTNTSLLNAHSGFKSYKWQNNSPDSTFIATQAGTYYVSVKDFCDNEFTDTVKLERFTSPVNFILGDTAICLNQSISLEPYADFPKYLWSTGEITRNAVIRSPGIYFLQVTDINGCIAKEFINVNSKNCSSKVYFPNSFTPNNDGNNDVFKAGVYGVLKQFNLVVYNRYGQKIFETTNATLGWDGFFRGKKQNQDTYTWIANYQLEGKLPEQQNGTIVLIR